jgi:cytochrome d ubiquinol oxidase subunit II
MLLVLIGFILRPVGFKYRSKLTAPSWRQTWDYLLAIAAFIPSLVFGVALGNVLEGVPFYFDNELRAFYTGSFWALLNPFALLCGLVSVSMLLMHGAAYLSVKTENPIRERAVSTTRYCAIALLILFIAAGVWVAFGIDGYVLSAPVLHDGYSNPLHKTVALQLGAWLMNFKSYPLTLLAPLMAILGAIGVFVKAGKGSGKMAFIISSIVVFGVVTTVGVSMFPFILPSSTHPAMSLLVWDASSSQLTLFIMLIATLIFLPMILLYTAWVYHVLRGKVTENSVLSENKTMY